MLTFFRRIRKGLLESSQIRKYLVYALGEILLVMIGILLALQVNNWNESKKLQAKSQDILREIKENLEFNNDRFENEIRSERAVTQSIDIVLEHINNDLAYHDSLDFHFLNVAYFPSALRKSSGYETLKSHGVDIIHSSDLRQAIIDLYEGIYVDINEVYQISAGNSANSIWPLFTKLFFTQPSVPNQPFESLRVTPIDYHEVTRSKEYFGLVTWWRHSRVVSIELRINAIQENQAVLDMIATELND